MKKLKSTLLIATIVIAFTLAIPFQNGFANDDEQMSIVQNRMLQEAAQYVPCTNIPTWDGDTYAGCTTCVNGHCVHHDPKQLTLQGCLNFCASLNHPKMYVD